MGTASSPLGKYVYGIIPQHCMSTMFPSGSLFAPASLEALLDPGCLKLIVSKLIGYTMFAASSVVKVPQILAFVNSGSVSGISPLYVHLELMSSIFTCCYNILMGYPVSTWGESLNLCFQNTIILVLYFLLSKSFGLNALVAVAFHVATAAFLLNDKLPNLRLPSVACEPFLENMPTACDELPGRQLMAVLPTLIVLAGRAPQIALNFSQGHTGQLSLVTSTLFFLGGVARLFTTLTEVQDPVLLAGFIVGTLLSGTLVTQILLFRNATAVYMQRQRSEARGRKKTN